jgi:hypothetical protein
MTGHGVAAMAQHRHGAVVVPVGHHGCGHRGVIVRRHRGKNSPTNTGRVPQDPRLAVLGVAAQVLRVVLLLACRPTLVVGAVGGPDLGCLVFFLVVVSRCTLAVR